MVTVACIHLVMTASLGLVYHLCDRLVLTSRWCFLHCNWRGFEYWLLDSLTKKQGLVGCEFIVVSFLTYDMALYILVRFLGALSHRDDLFFDKN